MIKFIIVLLLLPTLLFASGGMGPSPGFKTYSASGSVTKWVGWPNNNGVPDDPASTWIGYGSASVDRAYTRKWTATEDGVAEAMSMYHRVVNWASSTGIWFCAYNNTTLMGYADVSTDSENDAWTSFYTLTEASTGSLNFSNTDVLAFGICYDGGDAGITAVEYSSSTGTDIFYDNTNAISGTPNTTVTLTGPSSSASGMSAMLRYGGGEPPPVVTYLLEEDFEISYSGWTEIDTDGGGTDSDINDQYTGFPLEGTYSLLVNSDSSGSYTSTTKSFTAGTDISTLMMIGVLVNGDSSVFALMEADETLVASMYYNNNNTAHINLNGISSSTFTFNTATLYYVWSRFQTGSPGTFEIWVSTNGTKPSTPTATVSATSTATVSLLRLYSKSGMSTIYDHVRVDDVEIGSNPQ